MISYSLMFKISYLDLNVFIFCTAEIDGLEILNNLRTSFSPMIKYTVAVFDARDIGDESANFKATASWYPHHRAQALSCWIARSLAVTP